MYTVPMDIPKFCNKCPFGMCNYNQPSWGISIGKRERNKVDGRHDSEGTYGYVCNVEFQDNGRYTKVLRANIGENIPKPDWCGLKEMKNRLTKGRRGSRTTNVRHRTDKGMPASAG